MPSSRDVWLLIFGGITNFGVALILFVLKSATVERRKVLQKLNDLDSMISVVKELQGWRIVVERRLAKIEDNCEIRHERR